MIEFFEALETGWGDLGVIGFFEELWKIASEGEMFILHDAQIYYVELVFPYIEQHFYPMPIPIYNSTTGTFQ